MFLLISSEGLWSKARPGLTLSLPQAQALAGSLWWKCLHCEGGSVRGDRGEGSPGVSLLPAAEMLLLLCATTLLACVVSPMCVWETMRRFKLFNPIKYMLNPKNYLLTCWATRILLKNWVLCVFKAVTQPGPSLGQDTGEKMEMFVRPHWLCSAVLHKNDWWEQEVLEAFSIPAHRGEGCRGTRDAEAHGASRQCLAASFHALVPRVQPAATSDPKNSMVLTFLFPPPSLSLFI